MALGVQVNTTLDDEDNMEQPSSDNNNNSIDMDAQHHVIKATYPIPQPLAFLLRSAIVVRENDTACSVSLSKETMEDALAQLVGNSIEAMDRMYFATPPRIRNRPSFQHRLCLRVETCGKDQTLTLTDLGTGMTRADVINALGIGHLSHKALHAYKKLCKSENVTSTTPSNMQEKQEEQVHDDESSTSSSSSASSSTSTSSSKESSETKTEEEEEEEEESSEEDQTKDDTRKGKTTRNNRRHTIIPCKASDVGGFYSALCALGIRANVGTKSKFDDYYEFEVGSSNWSTFQVTRPMKEGTQPTVESGHAKFSDVRGDCGTRVTIQLNREAIARGWLDEDTLKPIVQHILETTQYTVAFSSDTEQARALVEARQREELEAAAATEKHTASLEDEEEWWQEPEPPHDEEWKSVKERSKYIPIRLSLGERKMLRLVEAAMTCCDYTTVVDRPFKSSARRTHTQLKGIAAVLRGLVTACDYAAGQELVKDDNFADYDEFFRQMLEIARRHKIMNPEKMRTEYGKLVFLLQDAVSPTVQPHLGFSCKGHIETVYKFLEDRQGLKLLDDKLIETATEEILAENKSRAKINNEIRRKEKAVAILKQKYRSPRLSSEDIHLCLYSICDNNSFLNSNRVPIDKVIAYLKKFFRPDVIEEGYSLSIVSGQDGARLSHSHERQYTFALQSLTLWRDIIDDMFRLWAMAEEDLLSETVTYALKDTGQGMQRVQQSPRTYKAMQQILSRVQGKVRSWVGSSVIHMGDHNVPNALSFIDKYTQVPRILSPIVACLENVAKICEKDGGIQEMVDTGFGGMEKLTKDILFDFFKSAFDGSGADNFYDAGSCIDGRLTSAWNWCSQLPTKPFYPIFKLTGFTGFDGEFK